MYYLIQAIIHVFKWDAHFTPAAGGDQTKCCFCGKALSQKGGEK
jgi:hypothetical protein